MKALTSLRKAIVSLLGDDSGPYPKVQVEYNAIATEAYRFSPYGLTSQPPLDSLGILMAPDCRPDDPVVMCDDPVNREKDLAEGEVVLRNSLTRSRIKLDAQSNIRATVESDGSMILDVLGGGVQVTSNGAVEVQAPSVNVTGDVVVTGNMTVSGTITGTTDVLGGPLSVSLASHTHTITGGSSAGTTSPPNP